MSGAEQYLNERQGLLTRLLDAVKQCQVRFGGRTELATDADSRVSCLCAAWESALQHGMKHNNKALSTLKQVTEMTGLAKVTGVFSELKNMETEPVFWHFVKEFLNAHEIQRYTSLKHITTEAGRGRAWLRSTFNEHSLERYAHMMLENPAIIRNYYEDWSFLLDQERSSMLPMMAAGLGSILFAINIDNDKLNKIRAAGPLQLTVSTPQPIRASNEPQPVIAADADPTDKKKDKKKKKKMANIVSFDDTESETNEVKSTVKKTHSRSKSSDLTKKINTKEFSGVDSTPVLSSSFPENASSMEMAISNQYSESQKHDEFRSPDNAQNDQFEPSIYDTTNNNIEDGGKGSPQITRLSSQLSLNSMGRTSSHGSFNSTGEGDIPSDLTPLNMTGEPVEEGFSIYSKSYDSQSGGSSSSDFVVPPFKCAETESAAFALKGLMDMHGTRSEGDGSSSNGRDLPSTPSYESMTATELRQAIVTMMLRKDEVEEQNRSLRSMYEQECNLSAGLRMQVDELNEEHAKSTDASNAKLKAMARENDLLKHQLKKYVQAVQLLRSEGGSDVKDIGIHLDEPQPSVPPPRDSIDYSHEASEYEKKLIQVAEMHGELMEFNEMLHRELNAKDRLLRKYKDELELTRGPLPQTAGREGPVVSGDNISMASTDSQNRALINIWIPSAFLKGTSSDAHHIYQIYIRIRDEEWNVYRRYSQFYELHSKFKKKMPILNTFEFPPKKALGNKGSRFVEDRRKKLQIYLRRLINFLVQHNEDLANAACKEKLLAHVPFFGDQPKPEKTKKEFKRSWSAKRLSATSQASVQSEAEQHQYSGL